MGVERARYEATRAERRYRAVDAENRLVARGLEREGEERLQEVATAEAELLAREHRRPRGLTLEERRLIDHLANNLEPVWAAPTTTTRDRKELLRTLLMEGHHQGRAAVSQGGVDAALARWSFDGPGDSVAALHLSPTAH